MAIQIPQVLQVPIPAATAAQQAVVGPFLTARANATADIAAAEATVDALVAAICGLTPTKATHPAHPTAGA